MALRTFKFANGILAACGKFLCSLLLGRTWREREFRKIRLLDCAIRILEGVDRLLCFPLHCAIRVLERTARGAEKLAQPLREIVKGDR